MFGPSKTKLVFDVQFVSINNDCNVLYTVWTVQLVLSAAKGSGRIYHIELK